MNTFSSKQKMNEIVTYFPDIIYILKEYKINFCHNENKSLTKIIKDQNINEKEIMDKINLLYKSLDINKDKNYTNWDNASLSEKIEYILIKYHTYLYNNLSEINIVLLQTLRLHGLYHPELEQIYKIYNKFKISTELHFIEEENIQFPAIEKFEKTKDKDNLDSLLDLTKKLSMDHSGMKKALKMLRQITNNYTVPDDGGNIYKTSYTKLEELEYELYMHLYFEKEILFKQLVKS